MHTQRHNHKLYWQTLTTFYPTNIGGPAFFEIQIQIEILVVHHVAEQLVVLWEAPSSFVPRGTCTVGPLRRFFGGGRLVTRAPKRSLPKPGNLALRADPPPKFFALIPHIGAARKNPRAQFMRPSAQSPKSPGEDRLNPSPRKAAPNHISADPCRVWKFFHAESGGFYSAGGFFQVRCVVNCLKIVICFIYWDYFFWESWC